VSFAVRSAKAAHALDRVGYERTLRRIEREAM
jgi:hypothetical protein